LSDAARARRYVCRACGHAHGAWSARCLRCHAFDLAVVEESAAVVEPAIAAAAAPKLVAVPAEAAAVARRIETPAPASDVEPIPLDQVAERALERIETGLAPVDAVLGGGIVAASMVVLGALAGCGKSTLTLQVASGVGRRVLYATGEETIEQVADRARRLRVTTPRVLLIAETDLAAILRFAESKRAEILVIDSIQTALSASSGGLPGTANQVRACSEQIMRWCKRTGVAAWIIGHVTADGSLAGPSAMRHFADVVLELDSGAGFDGNERILRCAGKNRFGRSNVVGKFEITDEGLRPVDGDGWEEKFH